MKTRRNIFIIIVAALLAGTTAYAGSVTKGLIGKQDNAMWNGVSSTFTRSTSAGYTLTLNRIDWPGVDVLAVYGGGVNRTSTTIASALTGIGTSNNVAVWLSPGTWKITSNVDWSAYTNVTFKVPPGAVLTHTSKTINIPNVQAGPYQIFNGTGATTMSGTTIRAYFEWWGATSGGNATTNATAMQKAIDSVDSIGTEIFIPIGTYAFNTGLLWKQRSPLRGVGWDSVLDYQGTGGTAITAYPAVLAGDDDKRRSFVFENFKLTTSSGTPAIGFQAGSNALANGGAGGATVINMNNVWIEGFDQTNAIGLKLDILVSSYFENIYVSDNYVGLGTVDDNFGTTVLFKNCQFRSNTTRGVHIQQTIGLTFENCVFESNGGAGVYLDMNAADVFVRQVRFVNSHFEANLINSDNYALMISGFSPGAPIFYVDIIRTYFVSSLGAAYARSNTDAGYISFENVRFLNIENSELAHTGTQGTNGVIYNVLESGSQSISLKHNVITGTVSDFVLIKSDFHRSLALYAGGSATRSTHRLVGSKYEQSLPSDATTWANIAIMQSEYSAGDSFGGFAFISAQNGGGTKRWADIVTFTYGSATTPIAVTTTDWGAAVPARTYQMSDDDTLQVQIASDGVDTYKLRVTVLISQ